MHISVVNIHLTESELQRRFFNILSYKNELTSVWRQMSVDLLSSSQQSELAVLRYSELPCLPVDALRSGLQLMKPELYAVVSSRRLCWKVTNYNVSHSLWKQQTYNCQLCLVKRVNYIYILFTRTQGIKYYSSMPINPKRRLNIFKFTWRAV